MRTDSWQIWKTILRFVSIFTIQYLWISNIQLSIDDLLSSVPHFVFLSLLFLFWCFIFINSRTGKIQTYGQPAKRKFSKRNFYSIRRILAPLLLVWIERVHRIVCDTTTSAKKPKIINNCCENLVNEREAPEIQTNPIILNLSALSMQWQLEWQRGKTLDTLQKNEKLNLAAELNFD